MKIRYFLLTGIIFFSVVSVHADPPGTGKTIFLTRCAACHNVNKILTGPALAGVHERHSIDWIINFVKSSQTLVKSGDKEAVALYQKFNRIPMPDHPDLTAENIRSIVEYIKTETKITDTSTPFAKPSKRMTMYRPLSLTKNAYLFIGYLGVVALLILTLLFAVRYTSFLRDMRGDSIL